MENNPPSIEISIPEQCPICRNAWESGMCPRCGLTRTDVSHLLQRGIDAYEAAREAALRGDFSAARLHLAEVRRSGLPPLTEHPAVQRLITLCLEPATWQEEAPPASLTLTQPAPASSLPPWLAPFAVGSGVFALIAAMLAGFAFLLSVIALILAILALVRHG